MNYRAVVSNSDCRSFVAEGFLKALSSDGSSDFSNNFENMCRRLWAGYSSPFFERGGKSIVEDEEYGIFRVASALGYSVAYLDASMGLAISLNGVNNSALEYRAEQWLLSGPTNILSAARPMVEPINPLSITAPSFCSGYIGGIVFAEDFLSVGVH